MLRAVRPEKNRQMSIKVAQKWFLEKNDRFWHLYKNCLRMWVNLGKLIVAKGLKNLPKVKKIAQSGHTAVKSLHKIYIHSFTWFGLGPTTASFK